MVSIGLMWKRQRLQEYVATYEAYAPWPMVLLTSRKGRFVGRGATWLPGGSAAIVLVVRKDSD
jgi:hypothetical protein